MHGEKVRVENRSECELVEDYFEEEGEVRTVRDVETVG